MLSKNPSNSTDQLILLAEKLRTSGRLAEAERGFRHILQIDQKNFHAWQGLFRIMQKNGRIDEALDCLIRANAIKPSSNLDSKIEKIIKKWTPLKKGKLYQQLSLFQMDARNINASIQSIQKALNTCPNNKEFLFNFSRLLTDIRFTSNIDKKLQLTLIKVLKSDISDKQHMTHAVISALNCEPIFSKTLESVLKNKTQIDLTDSHLQKSLNNELFLNILNTTLVTDQSIEKLLTIIRKKLLEDIFSNFENISDIKFENLSNFACALATQCFNNEYVFNVTEQENEWLISLRSSTNSHLYPSTPSIFFAILACYQPLIQLNDSEKLTSNTKNATWNQLISLQVTDLAEENILNKSISSLTDLKTTVSHKVQEQYEENPFPRWLYLPLTNHEDTIATYVAKQFPLATFNTNKKGPPEILIAGCGTGLIPCTYAKIFPESKILAIDLSKASLAYGKRKALELGLTNIEFFQGDILALGCLDRKFDFINCYGVLHHTHSILESWKVLRNLLQPDGFMEIGLYSKIARKSVFEVRDHIAEYNYPSTQDGMRLCRQDLIKSDNALLQQIVNSWAFYSMSNFRDLAFHAHEICISLKDLNNLLEQLSLEFIGFSHQHPETVPQYKALYPEDKAMISFENWQEFEEKHPTTFENCYKFWVRPI